MNLLTIETTCDETAAAVVTDRLEVLSSVVASQDALHERFGGVVPEIASRAHVERILPVIDEALRKADLTLADLDAVAVANTPGLAGSLLVGLTAAKTLCVACDLPLVAVNHLQAHIYACRLASGVDVFPCVGLVVSGGHSNLYRCADGRPISRRWAARSTTRPAKRSTKSPACSACRIRAGRRSNGPHAAAIRDEHRFPRPLLGRPRAARFQLQRPEDGGAVPGRGAGQGGRERPARAADSAPAGHCRYRRQLSRKRSSTAWSARRNWLWKRPATARFASAAAWRRTGDSASGWKPRRRSAATRCTCRRCRCAPTTP